MGNTKQKDSNLKNIEYYTGRCPVQCEQCFANLGQNGCTVPKNIMHPTKGKKWRAYAEQHGYKAKQTYMIPKMPPGLFRRRTKTVTVTGGKKLPVFLRASSMSDSALSPPWWLDQVRTVWGDYCFFNASIRAIKKRPEAMEHFHKVVVTLNPGKQKLPAFKWDLGSTKGVSISDIKGSMGSRAPMDLLDPYTLSDIGLTEHEDKIKFYRLRAFSTIWPYIEEVPGHYYDLNPIVVTQMRLRSVAHACEMARKYGFEIEVRTSGSKIKKEAKAFGIEVVKVKKGEPTTVLLRCDDSRLNASPYRKEATVLEYKKGFLRPTEYHEGSWPDWPYVCDRAYGSCTQCGLCATLDGTADNWVNPLSPYAPTPYVGVYVGSSSDEEDYFSDILEAALQWRENPDDETPEERLEWIEAALSEVAGYLNSGGDPEDYYVDGWNTHEGAASITAYCIWCLMRKCKRQGMAKREATESINKFIQDATDDTAILDDTSDVWDMWENESLWNDEFGSTDE